MRARPVSAATSQTAIKLLGPLGHRSTAKKKNETRKKMKNEKLKRKMKNEKEKRKERVKE
jgi:hypothetical protein